MSRDILTNHPSYYSSIRDEVILWIKENWHAWTYEEKPEWFTERVKEGIPKEMIPSDDDEANIFRGGTA